MMTNRSAPSLTKWPFIVGDLLLVGLAWWIVSRSPDPFALWPLSVTVLCVGVGAWLCVMPFLNEYQSAMRMAESEGLHQVVEKINELQKLAEQIGHATGQWQDIQDKASHTTLAAKEVAERMTSEAKAFADFMQKSNDSEKSHLRLEVEKLRRNETEWLQVLVHLMDHVHALYQAGVRSGKTSLIDQLANYQRATREVVRRVGLVPIDVQKQDPFDPNLHELAEPDAELPENPQIAQAIATGFTFQGQVIRKPLVRLLIPEPPPPTSGELFQLESDSPEGNRDASSSDKQILNLES